MNDRWAAILRGESPLRFAQRAPTELHVVRNEGSVPFIVDTLYVLPHGTPSTGIRVDQPQPSVCPSIN